MSKLRLMSAAVVAASLVAGATAADAGTRTVEIGDNYFQSPDEETKTVRIQKGSSIKWVWAGNTKHNVRLLSAKPKLKRKKNRYNFSRRRDGEETQKFNRVGRYKFYCSIHDVAGDRQRVIIKVRRPT